MRARSRALGPLRPSARACNRTHFAIASGVRLRYRSSMKRGLNTVRCSGEGSHRLQSVEGSSRAGFALIELLVVVAILLLLFTLYWGSSNSDDQQRQAQKDCQTHLQKIYMAMDIYANEHAGKFIRSEEHTSELQSPCNLVCRLLLEKKKQRTRHSPALTYYTPDPPPL